MCNQGDAVGSTWIWNFQPMRRCYITRTSDDVHQASFLLQNSNNYAHGPWQNRFWCSCKQGLCRDQGCSYHRVYRAYATPFCTKKKRERERDVDLSSTPILTVTSRKPLGGKTHMNIIMYTCACEADTRAWCHKCDLANFPRLAKYPAHSTCAASVGYIM